MPQGCQQCMAAAAKIECYCQNPSCAVETSGPFGISRTLRRMTFHGWESTWFSGDRAVYACPVCGRKRKFALHSGSHGHYEVV
jgi:hypothetical protein